MSSTPPSLPAQFFRRPPSQPRQLPVDPEWKCQRDGACCKSVPEIRMTSEERTLFLRSLLDGVKTQWRETDDGMWALKAKPCPAYLFNECTVYENRPYECRRYGCLRPDVKTEPWTETGHMERFQTSRVARRMLTLMQNRAMRWAEKHGWGPLRIKEYELDKAVKEAAAKVQGLSSEPAYKRPFFTLPTALQELADQKAEIRRVFSGALRRIEAHRRKR